MQENSVERFGDNPSANQDFDFSYDTFSHFLQNMLSSRRTEVHQAMQDLFQRSAATQRAQTLLDTLRSERHGEGVLSTFEQALQTCQDERNRQARNAYQSWMRMASEISHFDQGTAKVIQHLQYLEESMDEHDPATANERAFFNAFRSRLECYRHWNIERQYATLQQFLPYCGADIRSSRTGGDLTADSVGPLRVQAAERSMSYLRESENAINGIDRTSVSQQLRATGWQKLGQDWRR